MTPFAALALYPLLAITSLVAITALRLGRKLGLGLFMVSLMLSAWVACLIALEHPTSAPLAERYLPLGILMSGPFVHAGADLLPLRRRYLYLAYGFGLLVALTGLLSPGVYFEPGFSGPGPLFWPVALLSGIGVLWTGSWMALAAERAEGLLRRRRLALAIGSAFAALGSGAAVTAHIFGLASLAWAAPPLLIAILLVSFAILSGETGRQQLLTQGMAYTVMTAVLGAFGVAVYFELLPYLAPSPGIVWLLLITFLVALPLDQLRALLVEFMGRRLFVNPIGVRDLAEKISKTEARVDHAEGLAEIGTMASAVAHELRNPLGVIKAQAALLERRGADDKSVARLREQVDRASHFIDDLLLYSRPRPLHTQVVGVAAGLRAAIANVREAQGARCPRIHLIGDTQASWEIEADKNAFLDVHTTILLNAIAAGSTVIEVEARMTGDGATVSITDDGPGVPPEITATLFEPFVTGRGRDTEFPGTGLGLAIARRWLVRHGGTIEHVSTAAGGARFVIRWPRSLAEHG